MWMRDEDKHIFIEGKVVDRLIPATTFSTMKLLCNSQEQYTTI